MKHYTKSLVLLEMLRADDLLKDLGMAVVLIALHEKYKILESDDAGYLTSILLLSFQVASGEYLQLLGSFDRGSAQV